MSLNTLVDAAAGAPARMKWRSTFAPLVLATASCTSFATVRSAEVQPGPSLALQASVTTLPGDDAGWFWSYDCEAECNDPIVGGDAGFTYGWAGTKSFALSAGASGSHPYIDGYVQLAAGRSPFGIGARVGPPISHWREHQPGSTSRSAAGRACC